MARRRLKVTRNQVLFSGGLGGIGLETLYSLRYHQTPDSALLLLFSAMVGLPVYLYRDSQEHDNNRKPPSKSDKSDEE